MRIVTLLALVVVVACSGKEASPPGSKPPPVATPVVTTDAAPAPSTAPCDQLTRADCLRSAGCTLHHVAPGKYDCRPDQGPCEVGIRQSDRRACEAVAACTWDPGECYCPFAGYGATAVPDVTDPDNGAACACGGGPAATCRAR